MLNNSFRRSKYVFAMAFFFTLPALAQNWESGAAGGAGF